MVSGEPKDNKGIRDLGDKDRCQSGRAGLGVDFSFLSSSGPAITSSSPGSSPHILAYRSFLVDSLEFLGEKKNQIFCKQ